MVNATPATSAIAPEARTIHLRKDGCVRKVACGNRERPVGGRCDFVVLDDRDVPVDGVFDGAATRLVVSGDFLARSAAAGLVRAAATQRVVPAAEHLIRRAAKFRFDMRREIRVRRSAKHRAVRHAGEVRFDVRRRHFLHWGGIGGRRHRRSWFTHVEGRLERLPENHDGVVGA